MNLGYALKTARTKYTNHNQMAFAQQLGLSQTYVSQIENGHKKPSIEVIEGYGKLTNAPLAVIMWMAITEDDVEKHKLIVYRELKPVIDNLIKEIFK